MMKNDAWSRAGFLQPKPDNVFVSEATVMHWSQY